MSENSDKILSAKAIIRFSDCDPFNHLNNSKYIDYFLNAREDQLLAAYNFSVYDHAKETGFGWVVGQHDIAYFKPAFTMETVTIESVVLRFGEKDILVEFKMWDEKRKKLKALMWSRFYYFDLTAQKSAAHTAALTEKFKAVELPYEDITSFEKRVEKLKQELKA